jgi:hypothetical protein
MHFPHRVNCVCREKEFDETKKEKIRCPDYGRNQIFGAPLNSCAKKSPFFSDAHFSCQIQSCLDATSSGVRAPAHFIVLHTLIGLLKACAAQDEVEKAAPNQNTTDDIDPQVLSLAVVVVAL